MNECATSRRAVFPSGSLVSVNLRPQRSAQEFDIPKQSHKGPIRPIRGNAHQLPPINPPGQVIGLIINRYNDDHQPIFRASFLFFRPLLYKNRFKLAPQHYIHVFHFGGAFFNFRRLEVAWGDARRRAIRFAQEGWVRGKTHIEQPSG